MSETEANITLLRSRIYGLPRDFYYIPNFLTDIECDAILSKIPQNRWTRLSHRRLQAHPSTLTTGSNALIAAPLPEWLSKSPVKLLDRLWPFFRKTPHGQPNHVLVNEYLPGQGIMPHEDGAAYSPVVATVSLGGAVVLDLYTKDDGNEDAAVSTAEPKWRILQEPGSLLVTMGPAYETLRHGIEGLTVDQNLSDETVANWYLLGNPAAYDGGTNERTTRVSLTYRDVLNVVKIPIGILGNTRPA